MAGRAETAALLLGGYLLGRTKRMPLVLALAAAAGGGRLSSGKGPVAAQVTKTLASSPEVKALVQQVTGPLAVAARTAAIAGATRGVQGLSRRLEDRATGSQESDRPEADGVSTDEHEEPQQDPGGRDEQPEQHDPVDEDPPHEEAREEEPQAPRAASPILVRPATQGARPRPRTDRVEGAFGESRTRRSGDRLPAQRATGSGSGTKRSGERNPVRARSADSGRPARAEPADRADVEEVAARLGRQTPPTD